MHHNSRKLGHLYENKTFKIFLSDPQFDLKIQIFCDIT